MKYFAGVEGGSSASTLVVLDETGHQVFTSKGPSTNPLLDGESEVFSRISAMVQEAKSNLNIPLEEPIESIGLCLSGCTDDDDCIQLEKRFLYNHPKVSRFCIIRNDTVGSVYTSNVDKGIAIISGTGQNAILFDKDKTIATCGGWGHYFADEGSGYWIAAKAYKTLLDDDDGFDKCPHDTSRLRSVILRHFGLTDERHIMCFYIKPDKKKLASLCKELYIETKRERDAAIDDVFEQAGHHLARRIAALISKADQTILDEGLKIFCVGSVFNAWDLIAPGFVKLLAKQLDKFYVYQINSTSALGAAKFGAKNIGVDLEIEAKIDLLYEHKPELLLNSAH